MTKKWLSLVLVLTLIASLFSGAAMAAPVEKATDKPVITFVANTAQIDITDKLVGYEVGRFYVDGTKAPDVALSKKLMENLTLGMQTIGEFTDKGLTGCSASLVNGKLSATIDKTDIVKVKVVADALAQNGKWGSTSSAGCLRISPSTDIETKISDYDVTALTKGITVNDKIVIYNPIKTLTVAGAPAKDVTTVGSVTTVPGKVNNAVVLTATAAYDGTTPPAVDGYEWKSSNTAVATVAQDATDKNICNVTTVGAGYAEITVTAKNTKGDKTATHKVIVDSVNPKTITVSATLGTTTTQSALSADVKVGERYQMTAVADSAATGCDVAWESGNTQVVTVDATTGVATIVGNAPNSAIVYARLKNNKSVVGQFSFTNIGASDPTPSVPTLLVDGKAAAGSYSAFKELTMIASEGCEIRYLVSNAETAPDPDAATIKATGTLYAGTIQLNKNGKYHIAAVTTRNGVVSSVSNKTIVITVPTTAIELSQTTANVAGADKLTLTAKVLPDNAAAKAIAWTIMDAATGGRTSALATTVTSDDKGITVATTGEAGSFYIIATAGSITASCKVTVTKQDVSGISANPSSIRISAGEKVKLMGVTTPANASHQKFTYKSAATAVATVAAVDATEASTIASTGIEKGVYVVGVALGTTNVTLTHVDGRKVIVPVTVTAASNVVAKPTFDPDSKVFTTTGNKVAIDCSTVGAEIFYTTDGSDPRYNSHITYTGPIDVNYNDEFTINAYAEKGGVRSVLATATYAAPLAVKKVTLDNASLTLTGIDVQGTLVATLASTEAGEAPKTQDVTWTSNNETVVKVDSTVENKQNATSTATVKSVGLGKATITVTTKDGNFTATCAVEVKDAVLTDVTLDTTANVAVGEQVKLAPVFAPATISNKSVTWESSNPAAATVSADGVVTGVAIGKGPAIITMTTSAKTALNQFVQKSCTVTVTAASGVVQPPVATPDTAATSGNTYAKEIKVSLLAKTVGSSIYYTLDGTAPTAAGTAYTTPITMNKDTLLRAIAIKDGKTSTVTTAVYLFAIPVTKVTLDKEKASLVVGTELQLNAIVTPDIATDKKVTWTIDPSNSTVATVKDGLVTAKNMGVVTVKATSAGKEATCVITVTDVAATGVSISPASLKMAVADVQQLQAVITPAGVKEQNLVWTSDDSGIVTVDNTGKITAHKGGTTTINATTESGVKGSATITVEADPSSIPAEPHKMPDFTPTTKEFGAIENGVMTKEIGQFKPITGETWEMFRYYYNIEFASTELTAAAVTYAFNVDANGVVTLVITNVGKNDVPFNYTWTLKAKEGTHEPADKELKGSKRTISGNKLTITKKPTTVTFTAETVPATEMKDNETKAIVLGTVTNYADFKKTGVAVTATLNAVPVVDPAPKAAAQLGTVSISDAGVVTLTLTNPAAGKYTVSATLTATGCADVKTKEFVLTVIKNPVPAKKEITVDAKSGAYKGSKGAYNVS
ncbi:MAG: Ig-like domain-containing protein, partial [Clostridia bacterium]